MPRMIFVEGVGNLVENLRELGKAAEPVLRDALLDGAKLIRTEAMTLAPRDTGRLARSIKVDQDPTGLRTWITTTKKGYYGMFHEFGTVKMAAHPFMRPAVDGKEDEVFRLIEERVRVALMAATTLVGR